MRTVMVREDAPLLKLLPMVRRDALTTFIVVDENGTKRAAFDESALEELCVSEPLTAPLFKALGMKKRKKKP